MVDVSSLILRCIVLTDDVTMHDRLSQALSGHGFQLLHAATPADLYRLAAQSAASICVLDASRHAPHVLAVIARLRRASNIGILVIVDPAQFEFRVNALLIGADAYLAIPVAPRELAALMVGVARRLGCGASVDAPMDARPLPEFDESLSAPIGDVHGAPNASHADEWALCEGDWVLSAPGGLRVELSQTERALLSAMVDRAGYTLSREQLIELMDSEGGEAGEASRDKPGGDKSAASTHRVSMVLSRLRKKARRNGVRLPIRVVRGRGYELTDEVGRC